MRPVLRGSQVWIQGGGPGWVPERWRTPRAVDQVGPADRVWRPQRPWEINLASRSWEGCCLNRTLRPLTPQHPWTNFWRRQHANESAVLGVISRISQQRPVRLEQDLVVAQALWRQKTEALWDREGGLRGLDRADQADRADPRVAIRNLISSAKSAWFLSHSMLVRHPRSIIVCNP